MRENKKETVIAFAITSFLLNVLILAVLCGGVWMLHSFIKKTNPSSAFLLDYTVYR